MNKYNLRVGAADDDAEEEGEEIDVLMTFPIAVDWGCCCNCCNGWTVAVCGILMGEPYAAEAVRNASFDEATAFSASNIAVLKAELGIALFLRIFPLECFLSR